MKILAMQTHQKKSKTKEGEIYPKGKLINNMEFRGFLQQNQLALVTHTPSIES
jgi:hypothetical protein